MFNLFGKEKDKPEKAEFKFSDPENKPCFTCSHVLSKERPILYVAHDDEGDWQFLCGEDHAEDDGKIISLKQAVALDTTVNDLYEMPMGFGAERKTVKDKWMPFRLE
jgi:hypothetical protein